MFIRLATVKAHSHKPGCDASGCGRKLENVLSLGKHNCLLHLHSSNADQVNHPEASHATAVCGVNVLFSPCLQPQNGTVSAPPRKHQCAVYLFGKDGIFLILYL